LSAGGPSKAEGLAEEDSSFSFNVLTFTLSHVLTSVSPSAPRSLDPWTPFLSPLTPWPLDPSSPVFLPWTPLLGFNHGTDL
jgi:hypothetical protein